MKSLILLFLLMTGVFVTKAQPVKRLYIANDDHTGYMWTANEATYDTAIEDWTESRFYPIQNRILN